MTRASRWTVIEAVARGVSRGQLSDVAPDGWYRILRPPPGVEPTRTLTFARGELGADYGFCTIASVAVDIVTPQWFHVPFRRPGTWICSALSAASAWNGGWYHRWPTLYGVTPAQLMHALLDSGGAEVELATARPGDIGFSHNTGILAAAIRFGQRIAGEPTWRVSHSFVLERFTPTPIATLHPKLAEEPLRRAA